MMAEEIKLQKWQETLDITRSKEKKIRVPTMAQWVKNPTAVARVAVEALVRTWPGTVG